MNSGKRLELTHLLTMAAGVKLTGVNTSRMEIHGYEVLGSGVQPSHEHHEITRKKL